MLKNKWRNCLYEAFLRPGECFFEIKTESLSAKKRTAFCKNETFLPQGSSCGCRKKGKTGLRRFFPALDEVRSRANHVCPFASRSPRGADAGSGFLPHGVPWRAAKCRRKPAFGFHPAIPWAHEVRAFPSRAHSAPVCAVLAGAVLTFCQNVIGELIAVRRPFGAFATGGGRRHRNMQGSAPGPSFFPSRNR